MQYSILQYSTVHIVQYTTVEYILYIYCTVMDIQCTYAYTVQYSIRQYTILHCSIVE